MCCLLFFTCFLVRVISSSFPSSFSSSVIIHISYFRPFPWYCRLFLSQTSTLFCHLRPFVAFRTISHVFAIKILHRYPNFPSRLLLQLFPFLFLYISTLLNFILSFLNSPPNFTLLYLSLPHFFNLRH